LRGLVFALIFPRIHVVTKEEAEKAAGNFTNVIDSEYRLSTCKLTLLDLNNELSNIDLLLQHKQRLRKLSWDQ
jgi:hypothetical protein